MSADPKKASIQTILVVDDEPFVCQAVKMMLAHDGHVVETAASAKEALAKFDPAKFDLVITDYAMEGMKGDELAEAIKRLAPGKPIILLTAFPPDEQPACIDLVVTKPFYFETLRQALISVQLWQGAQTN